MKEFRPPKGNLSWCMEGVRPPKGNLSWCMDGVRTPEGNLSWCIKRIRTPKGNLSWCMKGFRPPKGNLSWCMERVRPPKDRLTNKSVNEHFHERFLCLDNEHIFRGDQGDTLEIMDETLTTARNLELEVNEDDIEELIMGHEGELTTEELQEILNEEQQETQRYVSPSEQEEGERGQ
ncbi:uncharacterized protein TNCV_585011 [Trichonephila clavipes]|nr:uncharacterized protein TNCV_585011 [Trichonephila clavipes]